MASDLINRKALLEAMTEHEQEWRKHGEQGELTSYATGLGLRIAMDVVCQQPAVEPMKWIPCSERMPEEYTFVLAYLWDYFEVLQLVGEYFIGYNTYDIEDVKAWMPLPHAYKDGEE